MTTGHAIYPSLHGKNVVVTGGAEGIGAAAVELFALQGSRVFFLDIATDSAQKVIDRVASLSSKEGGPAVVPPVFFHCDVTDLDKLQATASQILEEHGTVHVLVNNAACRVETEDVTPASWDLSINTNLRHVFFLTQAFLPAMKRAGGGSIVNMGSITWRIPAAGTPAYAACKAGIMGMTRSQSKEFGRFGVRINSVMPGSIATQRQVDEVLTDEYRAEVLRSQSLQRHLTPMDVARVIVFLGSDEASGVTGSSYYTVDGGWCSDP
ncbi:hypothetical protein SLS63_008061 [Diaporthe eres]|uniref:Short chain dehydrogenase n=1 Tax=Diaporthe eres TaxID=83184 RepID=A0ABR1P3Q0_DIAER